MYELIADSSEKRTNLRLMRDLQLVHKLLHILSDVKQNTTRQVLLALLGILLAQPRQADLLWYVLKKNNLSINVFALPQHLVDFRFGQFIVATLPLSSEKSLVLREAEGGKEGEGESILLRNRCLQLLHSLLFTNSKINAGFVFVFFYV